MNAKEKLQRNIDTMLSKLERELTMQQFEIVNSLIEWNLELEQECNI